MSVTRIDAVEILPASDALLGSALDQPSVGESIETYRVDITGWALGEHRPIVSVEVYARGLLLIARGVSQRRPDLAEAYPAVAWAGRAGFSVAISLLGLPGAFELEIVVIADNGERVKLGTIRGWRQPLSAESQRAFQPLLVTTLGRSGSTWLMRLLTHHPALFSYRPFRQETRVAAYWLEVLKTLTSPSSYSLAISQPGVTGLHWWAGTGASALSSESSPQLVEWLGQEHVEDLVRFCRDRITSFYEQMAVQEGEERPLYVGEKIPPSIVPLLAHDLFPTAPQLLLVRDFRDMYCSMVAYSEKLGNKLLFGRGEASTDEEHISLVSRNARALLRSWQNRRDLLHVVRYEDIVVNPIGTLSEILRYIGLDGDVAAVTSIFETASKLSAGIAQHRTVAEASETIGRWRRDLSPELQEVCGEVFKPALLAFGYE